jgi:hypothetical protein
MEPSTATHTSLFGLVRGLTNESRTFIRQELKLVQTEFFERISCLGRNAAALAAGGLVACAGLMVFLIGLGWLLAYAFESAGMGTTQAAFLGQAIIGLVSAMIGGALLFKGMKTISQNSFAPKRTLHTLQELKGVESPRSRTTAETPCSKELGARVEATENRMEETMHELGRRLSPEHINAQLKQRIVEKPISAGFMAMLVGVMSGLLLRRKFRHA